MWMLYAYFIRDALFELYDIGRDVAAWAFAGDAQPSLPAIGRFLEAVKTYGIVVLANGALLIAWARYNQYRFSRPDLRPVSPPVTSADLAARYGVDVEDVERWQHSRNLVMRHAPDGTLIEVTPMDAAAPAGRLRRLFS